MDPLIDSPAFSTVKARTSGSAGNWRRSGCSPRSSRSDGRQGRSSPGLLEVHRCPQPLARNVAGKSASKYTSCTECSNSRPAISDSRQPAARSKTGPLQQEFEAENFPLRRRRQPRSVRYLPRPERESALTPPSHGTTVSLPDTRRRGCGSVSSRSDSPSCFGLSRR
jgi:hypothetical protein